MSNETIVVTREARAFLKEHPDFHASENSGRFAPNAFDTREEVEELVEGYYDKGALKVEIAWITHLFDGWEHLKTKRVDEMTEAELAGCWPDTLFVILDPNQSVQDRDALWIGVWADEKELLIYDDEEGSERHVISLWWD